MLNFWSKLLGIIIILNLISCSDDSRKEYFLNEEVLANDHDFQALLNLTLEAFSITSTNKFSISQEQQLISINNIVRKQQQHESISEKELNTFAQALGFSNIATLDSMRITTSKYMIELMNKYGQELFKNQDLLTKAIEKVKNDDLIRLRGGCRDCCEYYMDLCWNQTTSAFWMNSAGSIGGWAVAGAYVGGATGGSLTLGTLTVPGAVVGGVIGGVVGYGAALWNYTVSVDECEYKYNRCLGRCGSSNDINNCDF